jgi:hypothetical protein
MEDARDAAGPRLEQTVIWQQNWWGIIMGTSGKQQHLRLFP